jgi:two-component system response regulator RegA
MAKRILVVDDDELVLMVLHDILARMGPSYEVHVARNAAVALAAARTHPPDLALVDIRLRGISGVELTEALMAVAPQMRVVWVTAHGCHRVEDDRRRLGVSMCLDKPVEAAEIRNAVLAALQNDAAGAES